MSLLDRYIDFCQERKEHYKSHWECGFFSRMTNRDNVTRNLIISERNFLNNQVVTLSNLIESEEIRRSEIRKFKKYISLYKDEGTNRISFNIVYIAVITILFGILSKLAGTDVKTLSYFIGAEIGLLAIITTMLIERDSITRRSMAAQQFVTVLEHWEDLYPERSE